MAEKEAAREEIAVQAERETAAAHAAELTEAARDAGLPEGARAAELDDLGVALAAQQKTGREGPAHGRKSKKTRPKRAK